NSVCAQKARIALEEKGQKAIDHIMTLRGDQYEPAYLKLNPSGIASRPVRIVVPYPAGGSPDIIGRLNASSIDFLRLSRDDCPATASMLISSRAKRHRSTLRPDHGERDAAGRSHS